MHDDVLLVTDSHYLENILSSKVPGFSEKAFTVDILSNHFSGVFQKAETFINFVLFFKASIYG